MELLRALGSLVEEPSPEHRSVARALGLPGPPSPAVHQRVVASQRWPYASVYLGPEGMMGGEARDRIVGFRRALGIERGPVRAAGGEHPRPGVDAQRVRGVERGPDRPATASGATRDSPEADHLAALLDLLAALDDWREAGGSGAGRTAAHGALLSRAKATLVWEHLTPWLRPYLASFEECGVPFYGAWTALLGRAVDAVETRLAEEGEFPDLLPAALRSVPGLPDPRRAGGDAFVTGLLAPARAGMVLVRDDLTRLADEAGLACRAGERRYALAGLLAQAPGETLAWLARRAEEWRERLARRGPARVAEWWSGRAGESARLLSHLAAGAAMSTAAEHESHLAQETRP